jgi:hypothetical protein
MNDSSVSDFFRFEEESVSEMDISSKDSETLASKEPHGSILAKTIKLLKLS